MLAAWSGHADVLRALLVKWPEADCDEAFSIAFARNDGACLRVLGERSFVWTSRVFFLLQSLPMEEVERVCARYDLPMEALRVLSSGEADWAWRVVKSMLRRGSIKGDVVRAMAVHYGSCVLDPRWLGDGEFWALLRGLGWGRELLPSERGWTWTEKQSQFWHLVTEGGGG
jgi:hypothetical protein